MKRKIEILPGAAAAARAIQNRIVYGKPDNAVMCPDREDLLERTVIARIISREVRKAAEEHLTTLETVPKEKP